MSKTRTLRQKVVFEASKTCTLMQKVRQKHIPLSKMLQKHVHLSKKSSPPKMKEGARKGSGRGQEGARMGVKNVYPSSKSASKTRTLKQERRPPRPSPQVYYPPNPLGEQTKREPCRKAFPGKDQRKGVGEDVNSPGEPPSCVQVKR